MGGVDETVFDDAAWKFLKKNVPAYHKFEEDPTYVGHLPERWHIGNFASENIQGWKDRSPKARADDEENGKKLGSGSTVFPPAYAALAKVLSGKETDANNMENVVTIPAQKYELEVDLNTGCNRNNNKVTSSTGVVFPCEVYRAKSTPAILPGGSVFLDKQRDEFPAFVMASRECTGPFCKTHVESSSTKYIHGDLIALFIDNHYFHFVYEAVLRLYPLFLHGLLEHYKNATILFSHPPTEMNWDFLEAVFGKDVPALLRARKNFIKAEPNTIYRVHSESILVVPRFNDYHSNFRAYNIWLLQSMRQNYINIVENPTDDLFISRRGYRRKIAREDQLFAELQSKVLPQLKMVLPDDYSVAEQTRMYANAKLIISPHGASLTNAIFSNWDKLILIELVPRNANGDHPTFRNDLRVQRHYLLKCSSVPCINEKTGEIVADPKAPGCDPWDRDVDVDVANATQTIRHILLEDAVSQTYRQKDFVIAASSTTAKSCC